MSDPFDEFADQDPVPSGNVGAHPDVRTVATLFDIGLGRRSVPALSEEARQRVWALVATRAQRISVVDPHERPANTGPGWRSIVAGLAVAAGVLLVPNLHRTSATGGPAELADPADPAEEGATRAVGSSARAVLSSLGSQGGERARQIQADYSARLEGETP